MSEFPTWWIMVCLSTDLDKLDNEKKDLIQSDISALHHFYSKHLEFPDNKSLVVLFAQVRMQGAVWPSFIRAPRPAGGPWRWTEIELMASAWGTRLRFSNPVLHSLARWPWADQGPFCSGPWVEQRKFALPLPLAAEIVCENGGAASACVLWHTVSSDKKRPSEVHTLNFIFLLVTHFFFVLFFLPTLRW